MGEKRELTKAEYSEDRIKALNELQSLAKTHNGATPDTSLKPPRYVSIYTPQTDLTQWE